MQIASPGMVIRQPRVKSRGSESGKARIESNVQETAGKGSVEGLGEPLPTRVRIVKNELGRSATQQELRSWGVTIE